MKKKLLPLCFLLIYTVLLFAQNSLTQTQDALSAVDNFLISQSLFLTEEMAFLARSREYTSMMTSLPEMNALFDDIGIKDFSTPNSVYFLEMDEKAFEKLTNFLLTSSGEKLTNLSPRLRRLFQDKIDGNDFANMLNGNEGSAFLGGAAILSVGKSWIMPEEWKNSVSVLLVYNDGYSSMTSFKQSGDGVISANSVFIRTSDSLLESLKKGKDPFGQAIFSVSRKK